MTSLPDCIHLYALIISISCANAYGYGNCTWLNPVACHAAHEEPVLGLVFLHNRKSGGTHVLHFLSQWLRHYGCLSGYDKQSDIEGHENINGGILYRLTPPDGLRKNREGTAHCPFVEMYHNEFYCISGDMILKYPPANQLEHTNLRFLTVIRDPIERIGSQFFHTPICYGRRHIMQAVNGQCKTTRKHIGACRNEETNGLPRSDLCRCVVDATKDAFENLRHNESVWFDWLLRSERGFREQHIDNYYVKRLGSVGMEKGRPRFRNLVNSNACLRGYPECDASKPPHIMLQHMASFHPCPAAPSTPGTFVEYNDKQALSIAKELLRDHFYFFVLDYFDDLASVKSVLKAIFADPSVEGMVDRGDWNMQPKTSRVGHLSMLAAEVSDMVANSKKNEHIAYRGGILNPGMYQRLMPRAVVQHIYDNNREDIELYIYARQVYEERFGQNHRHMI